MAITVWEAIKRNEKATALAAVLSREPLSADDIRHMSPAQWKRYARLANVNPPNPKDPEETVNAVVSMTLGMRAAAATRPVDAFEGF